MSVAPRRAKVTGKRGDWTAEMDGARHAVIHDIWWTAPKGYLDPMEGADLKGKRYAELVQALQDSDVAVMQKTSRDGAQTREGFIGVFRFTNLEVADDGAVSFDITERLPIRPHA